MKCSRPAVEEITTTLAVDDCSRNGNAAATKRLAPKRSTARFASQAASHEVRIQRSPIPRVAVEEAQFVGVDVEHGIGRGLQTDTHDLTGVEGGGRAPTLLE